MVINPQSMSFWTTKSGRRKNKGNLYTRLAFGFAYCFLSFLFFGLMIFVRKSHCDWISINQTATNFLLQFIPSFGLILYYFFHGDRFKRTTSYPMGRNALKPLTTLSVAMMMSLGYLRYGVESVKILVEKKENLTEYIKSEGNCISSSVYVGVAISNVATFLCIQCILNLRKLNLDPCQVFLLDSRHKCILSACTLVAAFLTHYGVYWFLQLSEVCASLAIGGVWARVTWLQLPILTGKTAKKSDFLKISKVLSELPMKIGKLNLDCLFSCGEKLDCEIILQIPASTCLKEAEITRQKAKKKLEKTKLLSSVHVSLLPVITKACVSNMESVC